MPFPSSDDPKRTPSFSPAHTSTSTTPAGTNGTGKDASAAIVDVDVDVDVAKGADGSDASPATIPDDVDVISATPADGPLDDASRLSTSLWPLRDATDADGADDDDDHTLDPEPLTNIDPNTGAPPPDELAGTFVTDDQGATVPSPPDDEPA